MGEQESNHTLNDYEKNLNIGPSGLGGWLIFIAIGLVITPISVTFTIFIYNLPIFSEIEVWREVSNLNSMYHSPLLSFLVYFELIGNIIILLLGFLLLYLFFSKKRLFPKVYFWFLIGNLIFIFMDDILANSIFMYEEFAYKETLRHGLSCAVWLPYLSISKRVKNTFIN